MKLWMSNETAGVSTIDTRNLRKVRNSIEEDLNNYLKSINYSNEKLIEVLLILIIRNDDFSATGGEECRKLRGFFKDPHNLIYRIKKRLFFLLNYTLTLIISPLC
jgi:hypothetical protein